ncbi:MAG: Uma2 family endonuclease [Sphingobacteriales bacterium]|nr:Uma2 family endonuclease [Sphingobacteriales bacterium]MBI3718558.1 Uma2 family endonuclease [Sphingobacteriales bacterium]
MENIVNEAAPKYNFISPEEYLAMERASQEKHEYYDGYVVAMSGARLAHNQIAANLYTDIGSYLKGKDCQVLPSEMRVSSPAHDSYMYPDAQIVCGKPELEDEHFDTLINPAVIIEILSSSTQLIDKDRKFFYYKQIPSMKEYFMIDSKKRYIMAARKRQDELWQFEDISESADSVFIETIQFKLLLNDIYRNTGL